MNTNLLACIDILNIPVIAGKYVGLVWLISFALVVPVFVIACTYEYSKFLNQNEKDPADFVNTAFYVFWFCASFLTYNLILKFAYLFDYISLLIVPIDDWANFLTLLTNVMDNQNTSGLSALTGSIHALVLWISLFFSTTAETLFMALRYILLEMAYVIGPLLILAGIYRPLRYISVGWVILFIQISFWPITIKLIESAILALQFNTFIQQGDPFVCFVVSVLMIIMYFVGVPALTAVFLSQKNMGAVAGGMRGVMAGMAMTGAGALISNVKGFGSGLVSDLKGQFGAKSGGESGGSQSTIPGAGGNSSAVNDDKPMHEEEGGK